LVDSHGESPAKVEAVISFNPYPKDIPHIQETPLANTVTIMQFAF
jgi:hypothetical protein